MKDIPRPHLLLKFGPKIWKSLLTCTCPNNLCCQKYKVGPLGFNSLKMKIKHTNPNDEIVLESKLNHVQFLFIEKLYKFTFQMHPIHYFLKNFTSSRFI